MTKRMTAYSPKATGWATLALAVGLVMSAGAVLAQPQARAHKSVARPVPAAPKAPAFTPGSRQNPEAEARLIDIYQLVAQGRSREALDLAQRLVDDVPNFQLAQLAYADLLTAQTHRLPIMGAAPKDLVSQASARLDQLRAEANRRVAAQRNRPPAGSIPAQFIEIAPSTKFAIAVDASRSRLYLLQNGPHGMQVIEDHYASIGRLGTDKKTEGDQRTPLGIYYITNRLDDHQLTDFFGAGALGLNYPNEYDRLLGRKGGGIWVHGVPSDSYSRSPNSTDGCVAVANPDLRSILERVQPRSTPVVIANSLDWVSPTTAEQDRHNVRNMIEGWKMARASGDVNRVLSFYSPRFSNGTYDYSQWRDWVTKEVSNPKSRAFQMKDLSILGWKDKSDLLVVTFGEVANGQRTGAIKRQYWAKEGGLWKIFYEGVIG